MLDRRVIKAVNTRIKAAGIIEVIIAMLIICVVMIASSVLYARLLSGSKGMLLLKAECAATEIYAKTLREKTFVQEEGIIHDMQYVKEISTEPATTGLCKVSIKLLNEKGALIYHFNALTRLPE
jgi:hypothetical protein